MLWRTPRKDTERGSAVVAVMALFVVAAIAATGWYVYKYQGQLPIVGRLTETCQAPELNLSIGPSSGTAGTIYTDAVFTNQSLRTCKLHGFPTLSLVDEHNALLGMVAIHNTAFPSTTVTLHPGESAHAAMGLPEPGNFDPDICSGESTNLKAIPPGSVTYLETPFVQRSCPGFSVTSIQSGS